MRPLKLELRLPHSVNGIAADPHQNIEGLLSELDSIETKLKGNTSDYPIPFIKMPPGELRTSRDGNCSTGSFVMRVVDDYSDYSDDDVSEERDSSNVVAGRIFSCKDLYLSDDSDVDAQCHLMDKMALAEGALHELTHELKLNSTELVRSKISTFESYLVNEGERYNSLLNKIDQERELQQERDRKFDLQYQRTIAEALDNHLTAIQRDYEYASELEERKIRDDAAREETASKKKK